MRMIFGVFGLVFLGIGLTVILWLWLSPFGEFGSPPLVFRIFGSFIAVAFVAMGGGIAYAALTGKLRAPHQRERHDQFTSGMDGDVGFRCPNCGAGLGDDSEVSPHGDVMCQYCNSWFNIHA